MSHKHRVVAALSVAAALVACAPSTSWARRVRTAASKKGVARTKPTSPTPKKYLQMHVELEQVYRNTVTSQVFGPAEAKEAEEARKEKRAPLLIDFQAPLVRLSADRYLVNREHVYLFGHAAITCEGGGRPLSISGDQLQLTWVEETPSNTVIEAQIDAGNISDTSSVGDANGFTVPAQAKPLFLSEVAVPILAKPVSLLLRMLQDEADNHGRFPKAGVYEDGEPFSVARYIVTFQGPSYSADWGSYSEGGQLIYDQRKQVLFVETRTGRTGDKPSLLRLTLADVTMARLAALLREGHGAISFTKPTVGDALARLIKQSFTSSTYK